MDSRPSFSLLGPLPRRSAVRHRQPGDKRCEAAPSTRSGSQRRPRYDRSKAAGPRWSSVISPLARRSGRTVAPSACTDIGTRVVVAVKLGPRAVSRAESVDGEVSITKRIDDDSSWLNGPPYAVEEVVFDENELLGCFRTEAELMADGGHG